MSVGTFQALGKYFIIRRVFWFYWVNVDTNALALIKGFRILVGTFQALGGILELEEFFGGIG